MAQTYKLATNSQINFPWKTEDVKFIPKDLIVLKHC